MGADRLDIALHCGQGRGRKTADAQRDDEIQEQDQRYKDQNGPLMRKLEAQGEAADLMFIEGLDPQNARSVGNQEPNHDQSRDYVASSVLQVSSCVDRFQRWSVLIQGLTA